MRYPASEKAEIIDLVERSHLSAKRTLDKLGIPRLGASTINPELLTNTERLQSCSRQILFARSQTDRHRLRDQTSKPCTYTNFTAKER